MLKFIFLGLVCSLCVSTRTALSQTPQSVKSQQSVVVRVRLVRAADKSLIGLHNFVDNTDLSPELTDLKDKLDSLPYERFVLVSDDERTIPIKKRCNVQFPGGEVLYLRPLLIDDSKVSLWLNWEDAQGESILDTRLHFDSSQSLLAGTDSTENTGMLLAINVRPEAD